MCGIFGLVRTKESDIGNTKLKQIINNLFLFSQTRGKEAAGIAINNGTRIDLYKKAGSPKDFIKSKKYLEILESNLKSDDLKTKQMRSGISMIGHSRLVTNGCQSENKNNQPIKISNIMGVHNGIITNEEEILNSNKDIIKELDLDTEIFLKLIRKNLNEINSEEKAIKKTFKEIKGTASTAIIRQFKNDLILATNNGSLFYIENKKLSIFIFASERYILKKIIRSNSLFKEFNETSIKQLMPNSFIKKRLENKRIKSTTQGLPLKIFDHTLKKNELKRCKRCILPETYPYIELDTSGICRYCREYKKFNLLGKTKLKERLKKYRSVNSKPDCIVALSGGRDSCYGLHIIKEELGMNPIAFTYDWGMVTDLARRNCARVCGKLGVEHIIRTPNIARKRRNVRKNVEAWLRRPELGMIPLFMAGDKAFFHYARELKKETGIKLVFFCAGGEMENTPYKFGFSGIRNENSGNILTKINLKNKLNLIKYYGINFLKNPYYLNDSLIDTFSAYWHTFVAKDDFIYLYKYLDWKEDLVVNTIQKEYEWETAKDTKTTWRIGDGTAAFYNYIYQTMAGFTEDDDLLSNMIRAGHIKRKEALKRSNEYGKPREESIKEYAQMIGINYEETISKINYAKAIF